MHKIITLITLIIMTTQLNAQSKTDEAYFLFENDRYFEFIKFVNSNKNDFTENEYKYLSGLILSLQNKPEKSNEILISLLEKDEVPQSKMRAMYESIINNYVHLFEYKNATEYSTKFLELFSNELDNKDKEEFNNSLIIWNGFKNTGIQEVIYSGEKKVEYKKDIAGLINIKVKSKNKESDFVFDTGANFSTISKTTAKEMGLKFVDGKIKVGTITGIKVDSELAFAEEFYFGDILCKNVVFLVLPDEALSFGGGIYKISGIIGLPLIKEMGEITISKNNYLNLNQNSSQSGENNLLLDGFTPIVEVIYKNDSLDFTFDTGARTTLLYNHFYEKYKKFIDDNYEKTEVKFGGAGGEMEYNGFKIDKLEIKLGNAKNEIKDISLISEKIKDKNKKMYGNLGQDFLGKYDNLQIDFKTMRIRLF